MRARGIEPRPLTVMSDRPSHLARRANWSPRRAPTTDLQCPRLALFLHELRRDERVPLPGLEAGRPTRHWMHRHCPSSPAATYPRRFRIGDLQGFRSPLIRSTVGLPRQQHRRPWCPCGDLNSDLYSLSCCCLCRWATWTSLSRFLIISVASIMPPVEPRVGIEPTSSRYKGVALPLS